MRKTRLLTCSDACESRGRDVRCAFRGGKTAATSGAERCALAAPSLLPAFAREHCAAGAGSCEVVRAAHRKRDVTVAQIE